MLARLIPLLLVLLGACSDGEQQGPLRVDAIGEAPRLADPVSHPPSRNAALLLDATAQGLVALDAEGQIEPALARRWTVLDDSRSYIFRLDDLAWPDGTALTAGQIARQLRAAVRPGSRNRLAPLLDGVEEANAVTPEILEVILAEPQIEFLQLLAQPDLALFVGGRGIGPYEIAEGYDAEQGTVLLTPRRPEAEREDGEDEPPEPAAPAPEDTIALAFHPAAAAAARFRMGQADLVLGGDWTTLPYAQAIEPAATELVFDPVEGLFGLAVVEPAGFLSEPVNRDVLSLAIDRQQLAEYLGRDIAEPRAAIVPASAEGLAAPVAPTWLSADMAERRRFAREAVIAWEIANGEVEPLRVALPDTAGSRMIFAVLRANWAAIGLDAVRVGLAEDADLRLVDRVAPTDRIDWYLAQFPCGGRIACSTEYELAIEAFETAPSFRVRMLRASEAVTALEAMAPFIPLLRPTRWSLVSPRVTGFVPNRYASHPFDTLIAGGG